MEVLIVVVILVTYYFTLVFARKRQWLLPNVPHVDLQGTMYDARGNQIGQAPRPTFDFRVRQDEIDDGSSKWKVPQMPPDHSWNGDRIVRKSPCHGKRKGERVHATGRDLYEHGSHVLEDARTAKRVKREVVSSHLYPDTRDVFYFECDGDDSVARLFYCSHREIFRHDTCIEMPSCENRQDGYKFENPQNKFTYYECANAVAVLVTCPHLHFFRGNDCVPLADPCEVYPADHKFDRDTTTNSYVVCKDGKSVTVRCSSDQYVHPTLLRCVPTTCENKNDGTYPIDANPLQHSAMRKYAIGYVECRDGIEMKRVDCEQFPESQVPGVTTMIFDGSDCVEPVFCQNVVPTDPKNTYVPGNWFRNRMNNYVKSAMIDRLYGTSCVGPNGTGVLKSLAAGEIIDMDKLTPKSMCVAGVSNVPFMPPELKPYFHKYYDCVQKKMAQCDKYIEIYDVHEMKCVPKIEDAFMFMKVMQVFKFDKLRTLGVGDNKRVWFEPYQKLANKAVCKDVTQTRIPHYNVCVDAGCGDYAFLKQMPVGKRIRIDATRECVYGFDETIRKRKSVDGTNNKPLNFYTQEISSDSSCTAGENIRSGDFVMDSTVYSTCDRNHPFVFCALPLAHNYIDSLRGACYSKETRVVIPAGTEVSLFAKEIQSMTYAGTNPTPMSSIYVNKINGASYQHTAVECKFDKRTLTHTYASCAKEFQHQGITMTENDHITIECLTDMILLRKFATTSSPDFIATVSANNDKKYELSNLKLDFVGDGSPLQPGEEFEMPTYTFERRIQGLM